MVRDLFVEVMNISLQSKVSVIEKAIKKFGKLIIIKRQSFNEFKEPVESIDVCKLHGFYYRGNNILKVNTNTAGQVNSSKEEKLMVIIDGNTEQIRKGDVFSLGGIKYKIIDLGNSFDLYYDITLERVT